MGRKSDRITEWTLDAINKLATPPGKARAAFHHPTLQGLVVDVTASGARTYYLSMRVRGRPEKIKLGRAAKDSKTPGLTPKAAYDAALAKLSEIGQGGDPAGDRRRKRDTPSLGEFWLQYEKHHVQNSLRPRTRTLYRQLWTTYIAPTFAEVQLSDITRKDVVKFHRETRTRALALIEKTHRQGDGTRTANNTVNLLRAIINDAIYSEVIPGPNPAQGIRKFSEAKRDRQLSAAEIARLYQALEHDAIERQDWTWNDLIKTALMTGARRGNLLAMRWDAVDLVAGTWSIPADQTKSARPYCVALAPGVLAILRRRLTADPGAQWVFTNPATGAPLTDVKRPWRRILKLAGIEGFTFHDLRHCCAGLLARSGASLTLIGRQLGHASVGTTARYVHLVVDDVQEALARATAGLIDGGE